MLTWVNSLSLNQNGWQPPSVPFTIMAVPIEEEATTRAVVLPSECAVLVAMHSCFLQSLGSMVGCSEQGGFHEEAIYHDEAGERIKRRL